MKWWPCSSMQTAHLVDVALETAGGERRVEPGVTAGGVRHIPHWRLHRLADGACNAQHWHNVRRLLRFKLLLSRAR